jgi:hypothetical protein
MALYPSDLKMLGSARIAWISDKTPIGKSSGSKLRIGKEDLMKALWNGGIKLGKDILRVYWTLLKIMVPTLIVVKLLDSVGGTEWLAILLSPFMEALGLPQEWGLVWAVAILTNIYTAMAVFYEVAGQADFTGAQITVLGLLILFAHSLPMEGAVAKAAGVPWWMTIVFRVGGGLVIGWLAHSVYQTGD